MLCYEVHEEAITLVFFCFDLLFLNVQYHTMQEVKQILYYYLCVKKSVIDSVFTCSGLDCELDEDLTSLSYVVLAIRCFMREKIFWFESAEATVSSSTPVVDQSVVALSFAMISISKRAADPDGAGMTLAYSEESIRCRSSNCSRRVMQPFKNKRRVTAVATSD
mmetsp:Transcript_18196/g.22445  ORF Transcript_18196/g.22445 Transcript_18196/m.22445 type:complete len:164 (-) Transcript_18196:195-686(-)